jgi:hypothetical protein
LQPAFVSPQHRSKAVLPNSSIDNWTLHCQLFRLRQQPHPKDQEQSHPMTVPHSPVENLDGLRQFVQETLCQHNGLEIGAFLITERVLVRGGNPCGVLFCLHGPRSVRFTAIWEIARNTILFYGSDGQRQHKVQASGSLPR